MPVASDLEHGRDARERLLLDMAQERTLPGVLELVVRRLSDLPQVALARIWLIAPGDVCEDCVMRSECPDRTQCLHLVASDGASAVEPEQRWRGLDGDHRRFPLGVRKVGLAALGAGRVTVRDFREREEWLRDTAWADREGVRGFDGEPLIHHGRTLGVLGVFTRGPVPDDLPLWLRLIADHAATAIANARAFEEIEQLRARLELENSYLREEVREVRSFGSIIGSSAALREMIEQIDLVAPTDASVLILGESGTGKELVAREIHARSERCDGPLIRVNCAAVPKELYESEFFGHVRGAFTGAIKDRAGRFQLADGGTLFLDEVGEIPLDLQSKLLRVLQEGQYERVGEARTRQTDVRVIAATNRDLEAEAAAGRFRQDLYYRLNVFPLHVAPLRERQDDIPALAEHFLGQAAERLKVPRPALAPDDVAALKAYDWPGNVRELQNVIERTAILSRGGRVRLDLPNRPDAERPPSSAPGAPISEVLTDAEMQSRARDNILAALARTNWKLYGDGGAAELLGIKPTTLAHRLKKLGIERNG